MATYQESVYTGTMPKTEKPRAKKTAKQKSKPVEIISIHSKKGSKILAKSLKTGEIGVIPPSIRIIETKQPICQKCIEVHKRDTKNPVMCPYCEKIMGCYWHDKGLKHMNSCKKRPILTPDDIAEAKKIQAKARNENEEEETKVIGKLNLKQEQFCRLYATDQEFFGNGVQSYIEVYEPDQSKPNWYKTACARASQLLSNVKVFDRINELLEETGFNDAAVDKQTSFLIHQHADFTNKLGAIREYNKIKDRYPRQKIDVTGSVDVIEVARYAAKGEK